MKLFYSVVQSIPPDLAPLNPLYLGWHSSIPFDTISSTLSVLLSFEWVLPNFHWHSYNGSCTAYPPFFGTAPLGYHFSIPIGAPLLRLVVLYLIPNFLPPIQCSSASIWTCFFHSALLQHLLCTQCSPSAALDFLVVVPVFHPNVSLPFKLPFRFPASKHLSVHLLHISYPAKRHWDSIAFPYQKQIISKY